MTTHRLNLTLALLVAALAIAASASSHAANPITSNALTTVTVDGSKTFSGGQAVSVVNDGGLYHMWYRTGTNGTIGEMSYATSGDGVSFTSQGSLSFASDPFTGGTAPFLYYENVSKVGADFKIQHWTFNGGAGTYPNYNYNISVSDAGAAPSTTVSHQGPIGPAGNGFGSNVGGSFGIVNGDIYTYTGGRDLSRAAYTDGAPPTVPGQTNVANYQSLFDGLGISNGYINNHSDVIDLGTSLGFYFTVRENSGARFDQQVYFSELPSGGVAWTGPLPTFSAPTLDGGADSFSANFAHADVVTQTGGGFGLYLSSKNTAGDFIIATTIQAIPEPATLGLAGLALVGMLATRRRQRLA